MPAAAALPLESYSGAAPVRGFERDHAVDLIKGLACLFMVVAHAPIPGLSGLATDTLGAVLFFSSTGMNLWRLLARRRGDELRIAANGAFLITGGLAANYVQGTLGQADVFQSAGMAMLAMLILERLWPRHWTWLFPLPFLIHFLNQHFYWKVYDGGVSSWFLAPGLFPLLPWLTFYMLGAHLNRTASHRQRAAIGWGALALCGLWIAAFGWSFHKFWMSPEYWLLGVAATALLLDALRAALPWWQRLRGGRPVPLAELRFWGANSLVFYILQSLVLRVLQIWLPGGWLLLGGGILGSALLLRLGVGLQAWARRRRPWPVLGGAALVAGGVLGLEAAWLSGYYTRSFASFGLTVAFIAAYAAFKQLSARLPRRPAGAMQ